MGCKSFLKQSAHVLAASAQLPTRWRWEGGWYERLRLWPTLPTLSRQGSAWLGWWWTRICWSWCHMATGGREPSHSWPASWQATGGRRRLVLCRGFPFTPPKPPRDFLMAEFLGNPATAPPPPVDKAVGLASSSRVVSPSLDNDQWSGGLVGDLWQRAATPGSAATPPLPPPFCETTIHGETICQPVVVLRRIFISRICNKQKWSDNIFVECRLECCIEVNPHVTWC